MSGNAVEVVKDKVHGLLAKHPKIDEPITKIAKKAGIDKAFVALGVALVPVIILLSMGIGHFVIDVVGFAYPFYATIKAVESTDKEDDTQWLTYWLVFSLFKVVEGVADVLISFIPFYFFIKVAFLVWCYYPTTQGAKVIYHNVIKPYVVPHLGIDENAKKSD